MASTNAPKVVLAGNPNVGKTSLFNHLTGLRARVGNYPGVTVERLSGRVSLPSGAEVEVIDAPGAYSLAARSRDEQVALRVLLGESAEDAPRVVIGVVDAGSLERSFYLITQILELRVPMVLALNMADEVEDAAALARALEERLAVPVVPTVGRSGAGLDQVLARVDELLASEQPFLPRFEVRYPEAVRRAADDVADALPAHFRGSVERTRALALWALSSVEPDDELEGIPAELRERVGRVHASGLDIDLALAEARYAAISALLPDGATRSGAARQARSERVDRVLLNPVLGTLALFATMFIVFAALFSWANPAIELIEMAFAWLAETIGPLLPEGVLRDLVTQGVIAGVGNVVVFLPQILLLFLFVGILEDSGYMARVAYLIDRVMRSLGLHGRAFVPILSGFACAVPAILATRTLERRSDRILTMMVVPLMTCSARLPVYSLVIGALFPASTWLGVPLQAGMLLCMYALSLVMSLAAAWVLGRTLIRGAKVPLILDLPPYRLPRVGPLVTMLRARAGDFLREAGTIILAATIVLWALLSFPRYHTDEAGRERPATIQESYGGTLAQAVEPVMAPLGFDWRITTGIIGAFSAREVFVSTMALVYEVEADDEEALPLRERLRAERAADGSPRYTPLVGLSLLVFFALACQCMSTLAVVRRETASWRYPAILLAYMTALAYLSSLAVYQGGKLLGF